MKHAKEKVNDLVKHMANLKPGAAFVAAQPTDDMWEEIGRLSQERHAKKSLVEPRKKH